MPQLSTPDRGRPKVLLVEDSPQMQRVLREAVGAIPGLEFAAAVDSADAAFDALSSHRPDVVILDLRLSAGSGLTVLARIAGRTPRSLVVVFTAHDSEPIRALCMSAGADRFYSKNTEHRGLIRFLRELGGEGPGPGSRVESGIPDES